MSASPKKLDLRAIPMFQRHPCVFDSWEAMEAGEAIEITNDHDPKALRYQFESEYTDKFDWDYLTDGPSEWIVKITKKKLAQASGEELRKKVLAGLDVVRPYLQADGGDVELVEIDETAMVVKVKLQGACGGCPSAAMTLKSGVEVQVKKAAPEIKAVEPV